jgi:hypothetical protein
MAKSWRSLASEVKASDFKRKPVNVQKVPERKTPKLPERKTPEGNPIFYVVHSDWFSNGWCEWPTYEAMKKFVYDLRNSNAKVDIAVKIEKELKYPGEIKVTVIRELRTIEYAR